MANKRNGIDVDKLDYFVRDNLSVFGQPASNVPIARIMKCSRPIPATQEIGYESKMVHTLLELFSLRATLHYKVYQHHTVKVGQSVSKLFLLILHSRYCSLQVSLCVILFYYVALTLGLVSQLLEKMVCDVLEAASEFVEIRGTDDKPVKLKDTVEDMVAYSRVGDWILSYVSEMAKLPPSTAFSLQTC